MMTREGLRWMAAGLGLLLVVTTTGRTEVAVEGSTPTVIVLGIIEGPDPIPQVLWEPVRPDVDPALVLNREGAVRGDGRPHIAYHPTTGRPVVVWAYNHGSEHDIAFAEWLGQAWSEPELLTSTSEDEHHPRAFVEPDGTVHVVWSAGMDSRLVLSTRSDTRWSLPETVVMSGARRPAVVALDGQLGVAWERVGPGGVGREVMLAWLGESGTWSPTLVASTPREAPLDTMLHLEAGVLWADWKHAADEMAWSRHGGASWSAPQTVPWDGVTWVGEDAARELSRDAALTGG